MHYRYRKHCIYDFGMKKYDEISIMPHLSSAEMARILSEEISYIVALRYRNKRPKISHYAVMKLFLDESMKHFLAARSH